jgi:hypothetical protein
MSSAHRPIGFLKALLKPFEFFKSASVASGMFNGTNT